VIGEALWRVKSDFAIRDGLEIAFAPGSDVPDAFVEDVKRMNYSAYDDWPEAYDDYAAEESLAERVAATGVPLKVIMGAEEQLIDDPQAVINAYTAAVPTAVSSLIRGVGHSPNVEEPELTAELVLGFDEARKGAKTPAEAAKTARPRAES
jgi:pimeloyl-ACP methyl ester carboxylesterase